MIGEGSRGGVLAVGYAGRHAEAVRGVINFVWGWRGERCVPDANGRFFSDAARTAAFPTLWSYAEHDLYYSASAIRGYRAAFEQAGGQGPFPPFLTFARMGMTWRISRCSGVPLWTPSCRSWTAVPCRLEAVTKVTDRRGVPGEREATASATPQHQSQRCPRPRRSSPRHWADPWAREAVPRHDNIGALVSHNLPAMH
jgi:hypothetical protein